MGLGIFSTLMIGGVWEFVLLTGIAFILVIISIIQRSRKYFSWLSILMIWFMAIYLIPVVWGTYVFNVFLAISLVASIFIRMLLSGEVVNRDFDMELKLMKNANSVGMIRVCRTLDVASICMLYAYIINFFASFYYRKRITIIEEDGVMSKMVLIEPFSGFFIYNAILITVTGVLFYGVRHVVSRRKINAH